MIHCSLNQSSDLLDRIVTAPARLLKPAVQLIEDVFIDQEQDVVFGFYVIIKRAIGKARQLGYLSQVGFVKAILRKRLERRLTDLLPSRLDQGLILDACVNAYATVS